MAEIQVQDRSEYLQAHFILAAIYGKLLTYDVRSKIDCLTKSLKGYEHVCKCYESYNGVEGFDVQYNIAKEMKTLLPIKLNQITKYQTQQPM